MGNTVYRVEHPSDHFGPYNHKNWRESDRLNDAHTEDYTNHPCVPLDCGGYCMDGKRDLCGFRDMRQLFRWFGGWLPVLMQHGFRVVICRDVQIVAESPRQVVFRILGVSKWTLYFSWPLV